MAQAIVSFCFCLLSALYLFLYTLGNAVLARHGTIDGVGQVILVSGISLGFIGCIMLWPKAPAKKKPK